ncbi:glycosyltransferase [Ruegeria sp. R14_0]|uniref:glycosyltransferase n=1 Tax=Ruegeria sp. R14_0 TaxID=2821100 RepID=UPI001ADBD9EC|nr:glycosyltransferase [Ruegeria sp. R14_0]MBO9445972.1 glycosyltransferase [Ruegeria sp. R14_0]
MEKTRDVKNRSKRVIGADIHLTEGRERISELLSLLQYLRSYNEDWQLALTGFRDRSCDYLVWNDVEDRGLGQSVTYLPYTDYCRRFPFQKRYADLWFDNQSSVSDIRAQKHLALENPSYSRTVLFVTYMHPWKPEGNSRLMLDWLEQFRAAGYRIHLLYYAGDAPGTVTPQMRSAAREMCDVYLEVPVTSNMVGWNNNGLNVNVDDWCGPELLDEVSNLARKFSYDMAFVNYAFLSAVLDRVAAYTHKVLLTHDRFENRNKRLLEQGLSESAWMSLTMEGETLASERADSVIALQSDEAEYFRELVSDPEKVRVISPVLPWQPQPAKQAHPKLRIGYFGSQNWINEQNLGDFMSEWMKLPELRNNSEFVLAGGVCEQLDRFIEASVLKAAKPRLLGKVEDLNTFFKECDIVINPERGGTGLKIKSLETMSHGMPLLSTAAGTVGFGSNSIYHSSEDISQLVVRVAEIAANRELVKTAEQETRSVYENYFERSKTAVSELIGTDASKTSLIPAKQDWPPKPRHVQIRSTPYVNENAADYHFDQFRTVAQRVDLKGKRVLEIGSDYHLISARLFVENGAKSVTATNIGDWKSDEPLPEGVTFRVGDMGQMDLEEGGFDLIYGIAILEHIPDFKGVVDACKRFLAPDGVIYLQGCPMWGGSIGHHVWFEPQNSEDMRIRFAAGGSKTSTSMMYRFTDKEANPIPDWSHLTHSPSELADMLARDGVPEDHANGIVDYVYNLSGDAIGSCSNFKTASEIVNAFRPDFDVAAESWAFEEEKNEHYVEARKKYSHYDLDTIGAELWMRHPEEREKLELNSPKVSIIVPIYNMEAYLGECLDSIRAQDYPSIEVILVNDKSTDGSFPIAERASIDDDRIKLVNHTENCGLGISRNTGVREATGEYLFFLDADDVLSGPSAIRDLVNTARSTNSEIVVGRANRFTTGKDAEPFDEVHESKSSQSEKTSYSGIEAFHATFGQSDSGYLPMRAWGYLFKADLFKRAKLAFPAGAHEDVGIVPVLCYLSNQVFYLKEPVVNYRFRPESISNTVWDGGKASDLLHVWRHFKEMLTAFGLEEEIGYSALLTAQQAMWKIQINSVPPEERREVCANLGQILSDATNVKSKNTLVSVLDHFTETMDRLDASEELRRTALGMLPTDTVINYYREKLAPGSSVMAPQSGDQVSEDSFQQKFLENDTKANDLLNQYQLYTDNTSKNYPSMLTEADKAVYYDAGRTYRGLGTIVDGGCFVGGTTHHLVQGLKHNLKFEMNDPRLDKIIKVYDLFLIDEDYIRDHLQRNFPKKTFKIGESFEGVFREQMSADEQFLEVFPGDVMKSGYTFEEPIEILGVDLCKALPVTDYVVRNFFPRVIPDGLVLQQDFIHEFHPHIHLSMLRLDDFFDLEAEMKWGGSVTFRLKKEITPQVIEERFGKDDSWFKDAETNIGLLEDLISRTFYDENRWVMILTLGFYYWSIGQQEKAKETYERAVREFPQFTPSDITKGHLYNE